MQLRISGAECRKETGNRRRTRHSAGMPEAMYIRAALSGVSCLNSAKKPSPSSVNRGGVVNTNPDWPNFASAFRAALPISRYMPTITFGITHRAT